MSTRIIQFPDAPRWRQDVQLDGKLYTLSAQYNTRMETWFMDLEVSDGEMLLRGLRLVLNWPLFYGSDYDQRLPPGAMYVVNPTGQFRDDPGRKCFENGKVKLVYVEEASL